MLLVLLSGNSAEILQNSADIFWFFSFFSSNFAFFLRIFDEISSGFRDKCHKSQRRVTCVAFFFARSFNEVGKTGKEEWKSKNENTRLGRWGGENLTVLPYLRIYFSVLNAVWKCSLETPRTIRFVTGDVLGRFCSDAGRSSPLRRNILPFMVTRFYSWRGCLSTKGSPHTTCNPTRMFSHKHVDGMLSFSGLRIRQTRRISCPSLHNPMLDKIKGRHDDSVRRRPCSSLRG